MRALRWMLIGSVVGAVLAIPAAAGGNGGAYIEFRRVPGGGGTHFLPASLVMGKADVYVPEKKQALLERGPFYAYLLPGGASIREGRPIPDGAIKLGAFTIERTKKEWFELETSFTVPDLTGDFYSVMTCNDPCTVSGFREPLAGVISIVQTTREGRLLTRQSHMQAAAFGLRRELRTSEKAFEELSSELDASIAVRSDLGSEVSRLQGQLARARAAGPRAEGRALIGPGAAAVMVIGMLGLAALVAIRRRRPVPIVVPDTIEGLEAEIEEPHPR
jgi:hypothetical protein